MCGFMLEVVRSSCLNSSIKQFSLYANKSPQGRSVPLDQRVTSVLESTRYECCVNFYRIIILLFTLNLFQVEQSSSINCAFQFLKSKRDNFDKRLLLIRLKLPTFVFNCRESVRKMAMKLSIPSQRYNAM